MKGCAHCGEPIKGVDRRRRRYCSQRCGGLAQWESRRASGLLEARFWQKVDRRGPNDCWPWTKARDRQGYGQTKFSSRQSQKAHRVAYTLTHGAIPAGLMICHRCDSPPCCNPAHLYAGTSADNQRDAVRAGKHRDRVGDRNPAAKLTADDVREIRAGLSRGLTQSALAERFGVEQTNISMIKRGATWRHV